MSCSVRPLIGKNHEVGHEAIDTDHQAIAECWKRAVSCEPIQLPFFIAYLKKLMKTHFDREAALLECAGGQLWERHREQHEMMLDLCDQANALSQTDWRKAKSLLRYRVAKLMRDHINCMDQIAAVIINTSR
jgi:hemerythrin-like metal-binding protein